MPVDPTRFYQSKAMGTEARLQTDEAILVYHGTNEDRLNLLFCIMLAHTVGSAHTALHPI